MLSSTLHIFTRGQLDIEPGALLGGQVGQRTVEHGFGRRNKLDDGAVAAREIVGDRRDQRWQLHRQQDLAEEALLGRFEDRQRRSLGAAIISRTAEAVGDARGGERGLEIVVYDRLSRGRDNAQERGEGPQSC